MLEIPTEAYQMKSFSDGFQYREYRDLVYVEYPVSPIQKLNLFIPQAYYEGKSLNGYTDATAPVLIPNTVGGYLPGPADFPGNQTQPTRSTTIEQALRHGYVVASPGLWGRTQKDPNGINIGKAPAFIVDLKAAIRYLRHNAHQLPGDYEYIITNGTSVGGATSALAGASGDHPFFESYLKQLGAADESDAIYAASCYCPIHNLEHADMAYEWQFNGINDFQIEHYDFSVNSPRVDSIEGSLTPQQVDLSQDLKQAFPDYVNQLQLRDQQGQSLTLTADGQGSFLNAIQTAIMRSAQQALNDGQKIPDEAGMTIVYDQVTAMDWNQYLYFIGRKKAVPAFDDLDLASPENDLFGTRKIDYQHFTEFGQAHSANSGTLADSKIVAGVNPISYLTNPQCHQATYWRIRHGASDRDTAFAIPMILAKSLQNQGKKVDFAYPWGIGHAGDYDLDELFAWIDQICKWKEI